MDTESNRCPYRVGNIITLHLDHHPPKSVQATIVNIFQLHLTCTMVVEVNNFTISGQSQFVLKLFERRFSNRLRRHAEAGEWNPSKEEDYRRFIYTNDGAAAPFFKFCSKIDDDDLRFDHLDDWDAPRREAYLQYWCQTLYNSEVEVYRRLQHLQGTDVPRIYARLCISSAPENHHTSPGAGPFSQHERLRHPGILMERIHGFPLSDLAHHVEREKWQTICDETIRIVNHIGDDHDICNQDVKPDNCLIRRDLDDQGNVRFKPVIIDFAQCIFRQEGESDEHWWTTKVMEDEEGAVGVPMGGRLRKSGGGYVYEQSERNHQLHLQFKRG